MRVTSRVRRDERGAVLIVVSVFTIVAVIFLAFVVDIGNQRQDRRQLTTATDAAALDVAQTWARNSLDPPPDFVLTGVNTWNCDAAAQSYLDRNRPVESDAYTCEASFVNDQFASVTVSATGMTQYQVAQAIDIDEGPIASSSSVRIRSSAGGALRPFAVCARDAEVTAWMLTGGLAETDITLGGDKFLPDECGENNANWGFVIFDMEQKGQKDLAAIIREGSSDSFASFDNGIDGNALDPYEDEKAVCTADAADNDRYDDQDPVTCLFNDQGAAGWNNNNALQAFQYLIDNEITFSLPIYGEIQRLGPGQDTGFPIIAFAEVRLISFNKKVPSDPLSTNDITLRFLGLSSGDCCDVNESNYVFEICDVGTPSGAVLSTFTTNCRTFTGTSGGGPLVPPAPQPCSVEAVDPPTQQVGVVSGALVDAATVTVTVADVADCDIITVDAVGSTRVAGLVSAPAGNEYSVTFPAGSPFGPGGSTLTVEVREDGDFKHGTSTISTVDVVPPCALISITPVAPSVQTANTSGTRTTRTAVTLTISVQSPQLCGVMTAEIRNNPDFRPMTGPAIAASSMQYTLPAGTVIPNGKHNNVSWPVRVYSNNVLINGSVAGSVVVGGP